MSDRLNVLVVTYGTPYPPNSGARIRDFNLIRELSRSVRLHLCIMATESSNLELSELNEFCATIVKVPAHRTLLQSLTNSARAWAAGYPVATHSFFYEELARAIRSIIIREKIDILQIEHSFLAAYRSTVPAGSRCRTILSLHNVGSQQYLRMANVQASLIQRFSYRLKSFLIERLEARSVGEFDHCLVVSKEEARLIETAIPAGQISVVENGVDCTKIQPLKESPNGNNLLFVGVLGYPPNADAVLYFCKSIMPLVRRKIPGVQLTVVGNAPPPNVCKLAGDGVVVTGVVEDLVAYYTPATVCVVPLRAGGGTRLKILEAMAFGRPVVSTSIGCEGLAMADGEHLLIGDSPEDFAQNVIKLLLEPELRRRITTAARRMVEQRYDWPIIGRKLLQIYGALGAPSPSTTT